MEVMYLRVLSQKWVFTLYKNIYNPQEVHKITLIVLPSQQYKLLISYLIRDITNTNTDINNIQLKFCEPLLSTGLICFYVRIIFLSYFQTFSNTYIHTYTKFLNAIMYL